MIKSDGFNWCFFGDVQQRHGGCLLEPVATHSLHKRLTFIMALDMSTLVLRSLETTEISKQVLSF